MNLQIVEIHVNKVNDLLDKNKKDLKIREDPKTKESFVENLTSQTVNNYEEVMNYFHTSN